MADRMHDRMNDRGLAHGPHPARRRLLAAALALTAVVAVVDLSGAAWGSRLRVAGATVLGPLVSAVAPDRSAELTRVTRERDRLAEQLRSEQGTEEATTALRRLVAAPELAGVTLVAARVVAVGAQGAGGPQRVTVDVGTRDGVRAGLTVVTADGLVGRTVSAAPWTADVLLVGAPDLVAGVRVGSAGTLGSVGGPGSVGAVTPGPGQLGLTLVQRGAVAVGDQVRTLGSPGNAPFLPGIPVGSVTAVTPAAGRLTATAVVRPAVDVTRIDLVGVLLAAPRTTPRPAATGGTS